MRAKFSEIFEDVTRKGRKLPTDQYNESGKYPIFDQGQNVIAGYTDEVDGLFTDVPAYIFGDHTRVIKYIDTPCFLGADGVKLLKAKDKTLNPRYLYYALLSINIPNTGYNRHFKWLKEANIKIVDADEQSNIVKRLDKIEHLISLRKQQLAKLDELVKARFVEMFGDPVENNMNLPVVPLSKLGEWNSGGTPSRIKSEYFTGDIDWYSAGELNSLYLNGSVEKITQDAINNSAAKLFRTGSLLVGMYDTAAFKMGILKKASASNQACACIEPYDNVNIVWLYYLLQLMKDYFFANCKCKLDTR